MRAAAYVKQNPAGMENRNILKHQSFNNYFLFSSRFTDSSKYEDQFQNCFKLEEERVGEICNACVLLVKRWKKLPKNDRLHIPFNEAYFSDKYQIFMKETSHLNARLQ